MRKLFALSLISALLFIPALSLAELEKCTMCHDVAEKYANVPKMGHLSCTGCHMGDGTMEDQASAHNGMYTDPTDFRIIDRTCGTCHPQIVASAKQMK